MTRHPSPADIARLMRIQSAGGPGIIIADSCDANGLDVPALTAATKDKLRRRLPEEASVHNPVDLIASATAESYAFALECVLQDPQIDATIAAFVPPLGIQTQDVAEAIVRVNARFPDKPMLAVLMGREGLPAGLAELHDADVPAYIFPESAAASLGAMWQYAQRQQREPGSFVSFETDDETVTSIIDATLAQGQTKLSEPDALRVLEAYGVPVAPWVFVTHEGRGSLATAAAEAAAELGFPVALKLVSTSIIHKTDVGAVELNRQNKEDVRRAVRDMVKRVQEPPREADVDVPQVDGILVQQKASPGRETIVGLTRMPQVGPMVMFGLGGIYVEVLRDVVLRLCPLLDRDADEMIREVRMYTLLEGVRGEPPRDLAALAETLLRVSQLAERHPRIQEMDINPLLALDRGAVAVDARIGVGNSE